MKTLEINATQRETIGSKNAKELRKKGMVPCVLYGGKNPLHFYADERHLAKVVYTPEVYNVKLNIGDQHFSSLLQEIQFHPVSDKITHIDFREIADAKATVVNLPVKINGISAGVKAGGSMKVNLRKIKVKGIPSALPDKIEINVEELKIGDSVRVKDLKHDSFSFIDSPETVIVAVRVARKVEEEVVAAPVTTAVAGAAPATGAPGAAPAAGAAAPAADAKKAEAKPESKGKK